MSEKEKVEDKVRNLHFKAGAAMHDRILGDVLKAHDKSRNVKSAEIQSSVWRTIMNSRVTKLAAVAVIIVGVLIGIKIYSGWGTQPGEDMAADHQPVSPTTTVVKENGTQAVQERDVQPTAPDADMPSEEIRAMLAASDFDGVAAMVAEGDSQTRLAVANFLAKMDDGVKALEVLDNLSAAHSADEPDNPFAVAAERLRNRIADRQNVSKGGPKATEAVVPLQEEPKSVAVATTEPVFGMADPSENEAEADSEGRRQILFGTVVDERGSAVTDARVFASFALHGRTDANGGFALFISPTDGSNSLGTMDFPMYVWAWRENDPYRVAWTLIRHPESAWGRKKFEYAASSYSHTEQELEKAREDALQYPLLEETHQGVKLAVEDENDLAQYIPGDPGELFEEPEGCPIAEGIVLAMGPAGVIMGQVTDASGRSVANATVRIEEFTLGLGMNTLTVNNLNHEWKADVSAVTDAHGYYQLSNLPISWTSVRLRAVLEGYGTGQAECEGTGLTMVRGCDVQLAEGQSQEISESQDDDADAPYRGELTSELLGDLPFSLPQGPVEARIEPVQARGEVSVAQLPSQENDFELVVRFDDGSEGGSDWYEITLYVGSPGGSLVAEFTIQIKAYIDGVSNLVLKDNTVYWHHLEDAAPGRHEGRDHPTYINDVEWFPEWSRPAEAENASVEALGGAVGGVALSSSSDDSSEDNDDEEDNIEYNELLYGSLIDERGNAVAGARVFGSYAQHGTTDSNGSFALAISPEDGSNSSGPADFPMYVWAYEENDPYRVAWTLIRHPASAEEQFERTRSFSSKLRSEQEWEQLRQEATQYPITEETHQGVRLVIEDENDLAQYIPGNPGRLEDPKGSPTVHDIVLVTGPATVITGRVTDANGSALAGATVSIDQLQMQLGISSLTVSELDHDWKAEAFAVTDAQGYYQLNNLPASWTTIKLKAEADGYATARQEFQNAGGNKLDGCDVQLVEGSTEDENEDDRDEHRLGGFGGSPKERRIYGGYRRARE